MAELGALSEVTFRDGEEVGGWWSGPVSLSVCTRQDDAQLYFSRHAQVVEIQEHWDEGATSGQGVITRYPVKGPANEPTIEEAPELEQRLDEEDESGSDDFDDILEEMEKLDLEQVLATLPAVAAISSNPAAAAAKQKKGFRKGFLLPKQPSEQPSPAPAGLPGKPLKSALKKGTSSPEGQPEAPPSPEAPGPALGTPDNPSFTGFVRERTDKPVGVPERALEEVASAAGMSTAPSASMQEAASSRNTADSAEPSTSAPRVSRFKMARSRG